ncbi:MAG: DUF4230 domain-containing protein [Planctomycetia bacterium]|nr:DUF4230 domain-containing protein [Planctomycetia bacterium]
MRFALAVLIIIGLTKNTNAQVPPPPVWGFAIRIVIIVAEKGWQFWRYADSQLFPSKLYDSVFQVTSDKTTSHFVVKSIEAKLEIGGESPFALGDIRVKYEVPCTLEYFVDLKKVISADITVSKQNRTVTLYLSDIEFKKPNLDLENKKELEVYKYWTRFDSTLNNLKEEVLGQRLSSKAREEQEKFKPEAMKAAKSQLTELLPKFLHDEYKTYKVIIRFREEADQDGK